MTSHSKDHVECDGCGRWVVTYWGEVGPDKLNLCPDCHDPKASYKPAEPEPMPAEYKQVAPPPVFQQGMAPEREAFLKLMANASMLNKDEIACLNYLAERFLVGLHTYGHLDLANDKRDLLGEVKPEVGDAVNYLLKHLVTYLVGVEK